MADVSWTEPYRVNRFLMLPQGVSEAVQDTFSKRVKDLTIPLLSIEKRFEGKDSSVSGFTEPFVVTLYVLKGDLEKDSWLNYLVHKKSMSFKLLWLDNTLEASAPGLMGWDLLDCSVDIIFEKLDYGKESDLMNLTVHLYPRRVETPFASFSSFPRSH